MWINFTIMITNEECLISWLKNKHQPMTLCLKDKLEELEKKLEEAFHSAEEDVEIVEGQVCVAYVDELFHRVRVIKKDSKKVDKLLTFFSNIKYTCILF